MCLWEGRWLDRDTEKTSIGAHMCVSVVFKKCISKRLILNAHFLQAAEARERWGSKWQPGTFFHVFLAVSSSIFSTF